MRRSASGATVRIPREQYVENTTEAVDLLELLLAASRGQELSNPEQSALWRGFSLSLERLKTILSAQAVSDAAGDSAAVRRTASPKPNGTGHRRSLTRTLDGASSEGHFSAQGSSEAPPAKEQGLPRSALQAGSSAQPSSLVQRLRKAPTTVAKRGLGGSSRVLEDDDSLDSTDTRVVTADGIGARDGQVRELPGFSTERRDLNKVKA